MTTVEEEENASNHVLSEEWEAMQEYYQSQLRIWRQEFLARRKRTKTRKPSSTERAPTSESGRNNNKPKEKRGRKKKKRNTAVRIPDRMS